MDIVHILTVDDEKLVLDKITSDIEEKIPQYSKQFDTEINIEKCSSGQECLDKIVEIQGYGEPIASIVTDIRMPNMKGDELLYKAIDMLPNAWNIIVTGYSDLDTTIDSIKHNINLVKYLKKPYDTQTLQKAVFSTLDFYFRKKSPVISMGGISFKEVETTEERDAVFRLAYDIYVAELGRFKENKLSEEQREKKQKYDEWDFRADTRQIIALKDDQVVGRVRIIYNDIPLETDFKLEEGNKTEVSKFMMKKEIRGTGKYLGLLRFVCHHVKNDKYLYISNLPSMDRFYSKMGFMKIGEFWNTELDDTYSAMHLSLDDFFNHPENLKKHGLNTLFRELIMTPVPRSKLENWFYNQSIKAKVLARKAGITDY